jgi:hypothetical protein
LKRSTSSTTPYPTTRIRARLQTPISLPAAPLSARSATLPLSVTRARSNSADASTSNLCNNSLCGSSFTGCRTTAFG